MFWRKELEVTVGDFKVALPTPLEHKLTISLDAAQFATLLQLFTLSHTQTERKLDQIMADINDLKTAVSTLVTDTSTALTDIAAKLAALAANQTDPAVTAGINDAVTALNALDAQVKAADPGPQA